MYVMLPIMLAVIVGSLAGLGLAGASGPRV
jgi:hypothetical protein